MKQDEVISTILGCSVSGYYRWKKEKRPVINLLYKYFTKEELQEFVETGEIKKQELIKDFSLEDLKNINKRKELILDEIKSTEDKLLALKAQLGI